MEELRYSVKKAQTLIVLDRALSFGTSFGPVATEIKSALYPLKVKPRIVNFVGGLGGRDITVDGFIDMVLKGIDKAKREPYDELEMVGVRE